MQRKIFVLVILILCASFTLVKGALIMPSNFSFNTNLKEGMTYSPDVSYLQNFLNQNPITRVSETGAGSDNDLTNFFGKKTKDAVMRFQNLYKEEILTPVGLSSPTGFFGEKSRAKANSLLSAMRNSNVVINNNSNINTSINTSYIEPTYVSAPKVDYKNTTFTSIYAENSFVQNTSSFLKPTIVRVFPVIIDKPTTPIDIFGFNFTATENQIYGNMGTIEHLPSTNNKITITLNDFSNFENAKKYYMGTTTEIYLRVANTNGLSENVAVVQYKFPGTTGGTTNTEEGGKEESPTSKLGVMSVNEIDKTIHGFSPQGTLIKLIGGDEAFDKVYGFTPGGTMSGGGIAGIVGGIAGGVAGGALGGAVEGSASTGGGQSSTDFGGTITNVTYCTCSGGALLDIKDIRGQTKSLLYQLGVSNMRESYNIYTPNVNTLGGNLSSGGQCMVWDGPECHSQGNPQGTIDFLRGIGTSLIPTSN